jgi:hypothetical protein
MVAEDLAPNLIRLYLSWVLTAIATIVTVLALVSWLLQLDALHQVSEHSLLLLLPVAACQLGKVRGLFLAPGPTAWRRGLISR